MAKEKQITVSDEFVDIYKLFNVVRQSDKMRKLSRKELLLLILLSIDSFEPENPAVIENIRDFKTELLIINDLQQDKECTDTDLLELASSSGEKYIDTSKIRNSKGEELPKALSNEEALQMRRDISIDNIID